MNSHRLGHLLAMLLLAQMVFSNDAAEIHVTGCTITLSKDGSTEMTIPAAFPKTALSAVELGAEQSLEVSLRVKDENSADIKPQQIMLLLTSQSTGATAYLVGSKKSTSTISINHAALEKQIGKQGGLYEVLLLLGDPSAPKGATWKLGTVQLLIDNDAPVVASKTVLNQQHVYTKPEIIHQFRPAEKRPPVALSTAFAVLPFLLLAVLVMALFGVVGSNFKGWPAGAGGLWALLFHGSIAAMLGLYMAFWVKLNLLQTLPIAVVISLFIMGTGFKALSALADARIDESKKKKE